jgi:DNA-binding NtrC family response regulator
VPIGRGDVMIEQTKRLPRLILIASDDDANGESIAHMLRTTDYGWLRLEIFDSYDDLLVAAKLVGPDVVICYGSLHDQPAVEFLRGLRIPVIIISAHPQSLEGATESMLTLTSPFHKDALLALVEQALERTRS